MNAAAPTTLVVLAHPEPRSFNGAWARSTQSASLAAGHSEGHLPADVTAEIAKIRAAERLILHFPVWWFGPPAILKGWLDRCLAHGALHDSAQRFDSGMCRGKKALLCVSTGSSEVESSAAGEERDATLLLWPLAYALRYVGFTVLRPELVHGVHGFHEPGASAVGARRGRLRRRAAPCPGSGCGAGRGRP